jgi:hypothetical protein
MTTYDRRLWRANILPRSIRPRGYGVSQNFPLRRLRRIPREQLRADLTRQNVEVKVQEDFKDCGNVTLDKLDIYIRTCDAVVHLIGDMTGVSAKSASTQAILAKYPDLTQRLSPLRVPLEQGVDISFTQWEAWLALYHRKALLIAQADEAALRGPHFAPTAASRAAQRAHLDRLRVAERYPGCTFISPDQLAKQIAYTTILDLLAQERGSIHLGSAGSFPAIGPVSVLVLLLITPLVADQWAKTLGVPLAASLALLLAISVLVFSIIYERYFGVLGASAEPAGSLERQGYDNLRENLATGGPAVRLYSRWLTVFLDVVDRFLGDAGMSNQTLLPRAFGLRTPAPLWTAPAFDRCLLLALIYPLATVYVIWIATGHVGPAEAALGLKADVQGWQRGVGAMSTGFSILAFWSAARSKGSKSVTWYAIAATIVLAVDGSVAGARDIAVTIVLVITIILSIVIAVSISDATLLAGVVLVFLQCPLPSSAL